MTDPGNATPARSAPAPSTEPRTWRPHALSALIATTQMLPAVVRQASDRRPRPPGAAPLERSDRPGALDRLLGALNAVIPKDADKLVLHSRPDFEDGALAVLGELLARGYRPLLLCERPPPPARAGTSGTRVRAVHKNTLRGRWHYLTAGTVITTHAPFRPHRLPARQKVLSLWHGESLAKSTGRLASRRPPESTWITAMSSVGRAFRCAEFGLPPSRVLITGAPRNDRMLRADEAAVRAAVLDDPSDRLVAWLPTFRVGSETGRVDGVPFDGVMPLSEVELEKLDLWLERNRTVLLAKAHPTVVAPPEIGRRRIVTIDGDWLTQRGLTLYTLLRAVDCLITDASTVWLDFLLNDRPIIFCFPDLEAYQATRGLNLEPYEDWVPGPVVRDGDELVAALQAIADSRDGYETERRTAKRRFHRYDDDGSTARVLDAVGLRGRLTPAPAQPSEEGP